MSDPIDTTLLGAVLEAVLQQEPPGSLSDVVAETWTLYRKFANPTVTMGVDLTILRNGKTLSSYQILNITQNGNIMTAMTMDDTADIVIATEDDHGDVTADTISWTASDGGANLTLTVSADTKSAHLVPVAEGTGITVTASDASAPAAPSFVATFDIGPGPTSQLVGAITVNTGANAAPAA